MSGRRHDMHIRVDEDQFDMIKHWAEKRDMSIGEYVLDAVRFRIAYDNHDYDLPDLEMQRLAQLIEGQMNLVTRIDNLEDVIVSTMRSLLALTRGDNYLADDEYSLPNSEVGHGR